MKLLTLSLFLFSVLGFGQVSNSALTGRNVIDFSGAASSKPAKSGTSVPATCGVGEVYFKTDATAGQNLYWCTATNTWTRIGDMIYPGAGVPNSTGSAWGTSYTVGTGANNIVQLNSSSQLPAVSAALLINFPTLNQSTTGSAATLTTPRAIYGNNFDGSAALTQIIASTYGGTGNGFTKFSGPTTSEKTFTLPNSSATLLTDLSSYTTIVSKWASGSCSGYLKNDGTCDSGGGSGSGSLGYTPSRGNGTFTNSKVTLNCSSAPYCGQVVGGKKIYSTTADITCDVSANSGPAAGSFFMYFTPATQAHYCGTLVSGVTLTAVNATVSAVSAIPDGSFPVGKWDGEYPFNSSSAVTDPSTSPYAAPSNWAPAACTDGILCPASSSSGIQTIKNDLTAMLSRATDQAGTDILCISTGGNTASCTLTPTLTTYTTGMVIELVCSTTAITGASTLNVDSLGAKSIKKSDGTTATATGDCPVGSQVPLRYDGTVFRLPAAGSSVATGSPTVIPLWGDFVAKGSGPTTVSTSTNDGTCALLVPDHTYTISKVGFYIGTASGTCGGTCGAKIGILDAAGTTILAQTAAITSGGSPNLNTTGAIWANLTGSITLTADTTYWVKISTDSTALQIYRYDDVATSGIHQYIANGNLSTNSVGGCTSSTGSGGSLSLGLRGTVSFDPNKFFVIMGGN